MRTPPTLTFTTSELSTVIVELTNAITRLDKATPWHLDHEGLVKYSEQRKLLLDARAKAFRMARERTVDAAA